MDGIAADSADGKVLTAGEALRGHAHADGVSAGDTIEGLPKDWCTSGEEGPTLAAAAADYAEVKTSVGLETYVCGPVDLDVAPDEATLITEVKSTVVTKDGAID